MLVRYSLANLPRRGLGQTTRPITFPDASIDAGPPSNMIQPAPQQTPPAAPPLPVAPTVAPPEPRWIQEGSHNVGRTLAAVGTVAALAVIGFLVFR